MSSGLTHLVMKSFDDVKPYFDELLKRDVQTKEETTQRIKDFDTLSAHIGEDSNWRYIHNSCDTTNEDYKSAYMVFITEISPKLQEVSDAMNKKMIALPDVDSIEAEDEAYHIMLRSVRQEIAMYREENIPLAVELADTEREYGEIAGAMTIEYQGETMTMQQAGRFVESPDRGVRKEVYDKIWARRLEDSGKLDELLTKQISLRHRMAKNAGYESFVEYRWDVLNRFDYTQQDVFDFHAGVKEHVVPIVQAIFAKKKQKLNLLDESSHTNIMDENHRSSSSLSQKCTLQPYDLQAPPIGEETLKPFDTAEELLEKGQKVMAKVDARFGDNVATMKEAGRFDLGSRPGKRPGGYNCPMPVSRYPFIFMNAVGSQRDLETFVHEAGHAMHSFCMEKNPSVMLESFRNYPIEIAEVASMSMELLTSGFWDVFYEDTNDLARAKKDHLHDALTVLCRISVVDSFQYWLYKNPDHAAEERDEKFASLLAEYQPWIDYSSYSDVSKKRWQAQLHIYEVPFYYIEYGIAQLGALGVWKNYSETPQKALEMYKAGLALGNTKRLPELFTTVGIPFDFSPARIKELVAFVKHIM